MKTPALAGAFAVLLLCSAAAAPAAQAQQVSSADTMFHATTLNLSAYGEVKAAPDMANISLGVQTQAKTAALAMAQNAAQMSRMVAALKSSGIQSKDIQTSGLNLSAQYDYQDNQPPRLTGYQASNQVGINVYDLARLGQTIDAVVAVGANQINGVSFALKDPKAAEDAARLEAIKALQDKAQLYAGATGYRVSRLITLSEGGGYVPPRPPMAYMAMAKVASAPSTPVEAGELSVRIDVTGAYELAR